MTLNFGSTEIISKGLNWITLPIIALFIPIEEYGELSLIYATVTIYSGIMLFGQNRTILRYQSAKDQWPLTSAVIILITMLPVALLSAYLIEIKKPEYITLTASLIALHTISSLSLRALENKSEFIQLKLSYSASRFILCTTSITITKNPNYYFLAEALSAIISIAIVFSPKIKTLKSVNTTKENIKYSIAFGAPFLFQSAVSLINSNIDKIIISKELGNSALGNYSLMYSIASSMTFITTYFAINYEAKIYRAKSPEEALQAANKFLLKSTLLCLAATPILLIIYYTFTKLNQEVEFHATSFLIVSISHIILIMYFRGSYLLGFHERTGKLWIASTLTALTSTTLNLSLIPILGITGAAISNLISNAILSTTITILQKTSTTTQK